MRCLLKSLFLSLVFFIFPLFGQAFPVPQLTPDDIDAILNSMTEEDFNRMINELSKMSDEERAELEQMGRQMLSNAGIDPDTGKLMEAKAPSVEAPATKPSEGPASVEVKTVKVQTAENVADVLSTIEKNSASLRQKAQGNGEITRRLAQWEDALNELIFYIKVINKKEHINRLTTQDFQELFNHLQLLARQLKASQPSIVLPPVASNEDNPYFIMGLAHDATQDQIKQRFKELEKQYTPATIKKRMRAEGALSNEINREIRAAKLTFSLIEDAYGQLSDPKSRKLLDEKLAEKKSGTLSKNAQQALTKTIEALSNSVYQNKLLQELQDFLKKYEPEQLAHHQKLEAAQAERKKEQEALAKAKPVLNPTQYDKAYPQQLAPAPQLRGAPRGGGMYGDNYWQDPYYQNYGYPQQSRGGQGESSPAKKPSSGGKSAEDVAKDKKKEEEDKNKKLLEDKAKKDEKKKVEDLEAKIKKLEEEKAAASAPAKKAPGEPVPAPSASTAPASVAPVPATPAAPTTKKPAALAEQNRLQQTSKTLEAALNNQASVDQLAQQLKDLGAALTALNEKTSKTKNIERGTRRWDDLHVQDAEKPLRMLKEKAAPELTEQLNIAIETYDEIAKKLTGSKKIRQLPSEEPEEPLLAGLDN